MSALRLGDVNVEFFLIAITALFKAGLIYLIFKPRKDIDEKS